MAPPDDAGSNGGQKKASWDVTIWERLSQTFLKPPQPKQAADGGTVDFAKMTEAEVKQRITQIDSLERKIGLVASLLAAVLACVYTVPYMVSKIAVATSVKPVGHTCAQGLKYTVNAGKAATCNGVYPPSHYVFPLVIWLVFALAIFVTVRIGRRAPMAFAIVLTGLAFGTPIAIVPFAVCGGWLLLRAWRTQKNGAPNAKTPLPGYVPPQRSRWGAPRTSRTGAAPASGAGKGSATTSRKPPEANKRYTPKTPPPKPTKAQQRAQARQTKTTKG